MNKNVFKSKKFIIPTLSLIIIAIGIGLTATTACTANTKYTKDRALSNKPSISKYQGKHIMRISDMTVERAGHAMTLLPDGRVLITGGWTRNTNRPISAPKGSNTIGLKSAEIFDPKTNTFSKISDMNLPHAGHSTILLKNGKVLIIANSQCEIFDPETNKFSLDGKLQVKRSNFTSVLLQNGNILIAGGGRPEIEIYNPQTKKSEIVNKFKINRRDEATVVLKDNKILTLGGFNFLKKDDPTENKLEEIIETEVYDCSTNTITYGPDMNITRTNPTATLLDDGRVLVAGGYYYNNKALPEKLPEAEIYDPIKNEFIKGPNMLYSDIQDQNTSNQAVLLKCGCVFFIEGSNAIKIYNPITNKFDFCNKSEIKSYKGYGIILLNNNKVLITGGALTAYHSTKDSWLYSY